MANKLGGTGRVRTGFLKGDEPSSSQKVGVDSFKLNKKSRTEKSNKIEKKKLSMGSVFGFSSVDPTVFWSTVVLIVAGILVIGATVFNVGAERNAVYGDFVNINYTCSYCSDFDEDDENLFDQSRSKIKIDKSNKNVYPFICALIGHHPGENIKFCVKNEFSPLLHTESIKNDIKIKHIDTFSMSEYKSFFGVDAPSEVGVYDSVDSPYGWPARVVINTDGRVIVEYKPDKNTKDGSVKDNSLKTKDGSVKDNSLKTKDGSVKDNSLKTKDGSVKDNSLKTKDGSVKDNSLKTKVIRETPDNIIFTYEGILQEKNKDGKEVDTVKIALDKRFVYAVDDKNGTIIYKNDENAGADLYYLVKFVSHC